MTTAVPVTDDNDKIWAEMLYRLDCTFSTSCSGTGITSLEDSKRTGPTS